MRAAEQVIEARQFPLTEAIGKLVPVVFHGVLPAGGVAGCRPGGALGPGSFREAEQFRENVIFHHLLPAHGFRPQFSLDA